MVAVAWQRLQCGWRGVEAQSMAQLGKSRTSGMESNFRSLNFDDFGEGYCLLCRDLGATGDEFDYIMMTNWQVHSRGRLAEPEKRGLPLE
jgi:hypothetical protein